VKRLAAVGVFAALLLPLGLFAVPAGAATPANSTITAPNSGSVTVSWSGTIQPGNSNFGGATLRCFPGTNPTADEFQLTVKGLNAAYYQGHRTSLKIRVDWTPTTNAAVNQLAMTTSQASVDSTGTLQHNNIQDATSGNSPATAEYDNSIADPGTYFAIDVCALTNASPQPYTATATLSGNPVPVVPGVSVGNQRLVNYEFDPAFQKTDALLRPNAGEPSVGVNWNTGKVMYMAGAQITQLTFDDTRKPATASFVDVTPAKQAQANEDPILYTDHETGRTFGVGLLLACSNVDYTDNDGTGMNWSPSTGCPLPHSPDHETLVSGPFAPGTSLKPTGNYPHIVYYCSQNVLQAAGAFCGHSEDGGVTFDAPSTQIFGGVTGCGSLHGHFRISPDGTGYVPQNNCARADKVAGQGMAVTKDNGQTYTYSVVPDSTRNGNGGDPSVAADAANKVYYGYVGADGHARIATSADHGASWTKSIDVGSAFHIEQAEFPEVITGDSGRAAFAFLGASALGSDQDPNYPGVWYLFVAYTYDGGTTWQVTNATPNDPVQRSCVDNGGTVGGTCTSRRNMLDFNGIDVDKQGRVIVAYTDGCTNDCETNPNVDISGCGRSEGASSTSTPTCTPARLSALVRQTCGRGLFAAYDPGFNGASNCGATTLGTSSGGGSVPDNGGAVNGAGTSNQPAAGAGGSTPNTSRAHEVQPLGVVSIGLGLLLAGAAIVTRRRGKRSA
jgi:hypothetical protein